MTLFSEQKLKLHQVLQQYNVPDRKMRDQGVAMPFQSDY